MESWWNHPDGDARQSYEPPEVTLEIELETRAGSPITGEIDPLDLTGVDTGLEIAP